MILTVLIALEFNHSIVQIVQKRSSIVQVRVIVLIAVLLIVRKFVLIDFLKTDPATVAGLSALLLALGALYWLLRDADRRARYPLDSPTKRRMTRTVERRDNGDRSRFCIDLFWRYHTICQAL